MIGNAVTLAALTTAAFYLIYKKLPPRTRRLVVKYNLVSDIVALLATYILFGGTVTALIAGALVSILTSMLLHIAKHPQDYQWLHDSMKIVRDTIDQGKEAMKSLNEKYIDMKGSKSPLEPTPQPAS